MTAIMWPFLRDKVKAIIQSKSDIFDPVREWLEWHFHECVTIKKEELKGKGKLSGDLFARCPTIGLRLQMLDGETTLAIRPYWSRKTKHRGHTEGDVRPGTITLELLAPGKLMTVRLKEGLAPLLMSGVDRTRPAKHVRVWQRANTDSPLIAVDQQADE